MFALREGTIACGPCKGKGMLQRDGKMTPSKQPFDVVCGSCNGIGHYRGTVSVFDAERDD